MRLTNLFVLSAATIVASCGGATAETDSTHIKLSTMTAPDTNALDANHFVMRFLRSDKNYYDDDNNNDNGEERAGGGELSRAIMRAMRKKGMTIDDYDKELGIATQMKGFETSLTGWEAFSRSPEFAKTCF
ncbi:hypothetical protein PHYBOEH_011156 [Phytophthora boehmeriae]|uniref:RxLR effector protein n=1 Tax=Phytophthora boehmeriae TaxID=109152 RepID=A0A8T1VM19_9STRA|nr:hypothetical protein PHYBOEH_011156 [Phytophthora boehmeriae]